ncbi:FAD-dependent monooxygenase [Sphingobacterium sp. N143]|uniref:FAD-dependent oxidoreductase n=1 Tax=Sphingobacterium sp. N143 TaxID=2746727 RepID=UPI0025756B5D|nr:NAD(P)/FAD-dependent oxidoreductase [Sphingobacterium sp. N143]MDM1295363.1 FAD-dependent monooxygenase [Sphingobacterium sp. N143]
MKNITENKDQIIIVGAGIAGLSLAIQLTEKKIPCIVLEARKSFGGATSGVRISSKGVKILEKMGIDNIGEPTKKIVMYFANSKISFEDKTEPDASPAIIVTRLAVFEKLRERINELDIPVIYDYALENVIEKADSVVAVSSDGQQITGKYLVGSDGVGSKVRRLLNPESKSDKRYAGYLGLGFIFPSSEKIEMSSFNNTDGNIGLGSIGKIDCNDTYKNNFLWMHLHMTEEEAKVITDKEVYEKVTKKSENWIPYLQQIFRDCKTNPKTVLYHQPVYNGSIPNKWYSERLFLIGDAAHPYGPGGQGISLAMLDAEALCELFANGVTEEKKANFQTTRAAMAKSKGESSEERNKPENQIVTEEELLFNYQLMKDFHQKSNGKLEM